jgi:hypothetical protein
VALHVGRRVADVCMPRACRALLRPTHRPWALSFSFGRALQAPALSAWEATGGTDAAAAQAALLERAAAFAAAQQGRRPKKGGAGAGGAAAAGLE